MPPHQRVLRRQHLWITSAHIRDLVTTMIGMAQLNDLFYKRRIITNPDSNFVMRCFLLLVCAVNSMYITVLVYNYFWSCQCRLLATLEGQKWIIMWQVYTYLMLVVLEFYWKFRLEGY